MHFPEPRQLPSVVASTQWNKAVTTGETGWAGYPKEMWRLMGIFFALNLLIVSAFLFFLLSSL